MGALIALWPVAFVFTCALELPIYVLVVGPYFRRWWSACLLTLLLNTATHPALWFLFPRFAPRVLWLSTAESAVVLVEAAIVAAILARRQPARRAVTLGLGASFAANGLSAVVGLLIGQFG